MAEITGQFKLKAWFNGVAKEALRTKNAWAGYHVLLYLISFLCLSELVHPQSHLCHHNVYDSEHRKIPYARVGLPFQLTSTSFHTTICDKVEERLPSSTRVFRLPRDSTVRRQARCGTGGGSVGILHGGETMDRRVHRLSSQTGAIARHQYCGGTWGCEIHDERSGLRPACLI